MKFRLFNYLLLLLGSLVTVAGSGVVEGKRANAQNFTAPAPGSSGQAPKSASDFQQIARYYDQTFTFSEKVDLQWSLRSIGYFQGQLDGIINQALIEGLLSYQQRNNVPVSATIDRNALLSLAARQRATNFPPAVLNTQQTVQNAQRALSFLGHQTGATDGRWGQLTQNALIAFQVQYGFNQTGRLDAFTYDRLLKASLMWQEVSDAVKKGQAHPHRENAIGFLHEGIRPRLLVGQRSIYTTGQNKTLQTASANPGTGTARIAQAPAPTTALSLDGLRNLWRRGDAIVISPYQGASITVDPGLVNRATNNLWALMAFSARPQLLQEERALGSALQLLGSEAASYAVSGQYNRGKVLAGQTEFQRQRSLQAFKQLGVPKITSAFPKFPLRLTEIRRVEIRDYDFQNQAFNIRVSGAGNQLPIVNLGLLQNRYNRGNAIRAPYSFSPAQQIQIPQAQAEAFQNQLVGTVSQAEYDIAVERDTSRMLRNASRYTNPQRRQNYINRETARIRNQAQRRVQSNASRHRIAYVAVTFDVLPPIVSGDQRIKFNLLLNRVEAFADPGLTRALPFFPASSVFTNVKTRESLEAELKSAEARAANASSFVEFQNMETFGQDRIGLLAARLLGNGSLVDEAIRKSSGYLSANEFSRDQFFEKEKQALKTLTPATDTFWLPGRIDLGEYDLQTQRWQVRNILASSGPRLNQNAAFNVTTRLTNQSEIRALNVPIEVAKTTIETLGSRQAGRSFDIRMKVKATSATATGSNNNNSVPLSLDLTIEEVIVLTPSNFGPDGNGYVVARAKTAG